MTHLLDTSAFLAYFLREEGGERVAALFESEGTEVAFPALGVVEFWARLKALGADEAFESEWELHRALFVAVTVADEAVAERAIAIRRATPERLPTIDSVIAATASVQDLVLVHRDPHFRGIPERYLRQIDLAERLPS